MRICLISTTSMTGDPRALAEAESQRMAGHEVVGVSTSEDDPDWVTTPGTATLVDRLRGRSTGDRLASVAADLACDLYQPVHPAGVEIAEKAAMGQPGSSILVKPTWQRPGHQDLISLAPGEPHRSRPASGSRPALHLPGYTPPRHGDRTGTVVIAYRKTERNPGRYLESALARAGLDVRHTESIDWDEIDPGTGAVIIVESPLPALPVRGLNPGVPVAFWVHHGEHHLEANTRLQRRYGAHVVLQAHSWHLAHRFTGLVERLPFGVAPELVSSEFNPHGSRQWDVAFVGAPDRSRYRQRIELLEALEERLGRDRVEVRAGVSPSEMMDLYRDARLVVDDAAGRHLPITMRVFEATGAGALLVSSPGPGMDLLFKPGTDFVPMGPDPINEIVELLELGTMRVARNGHDKAWRHHTYDLRGAELLTVIDRVREESVEPPEPAAPESGLSGIVDRFPDAQRILDLGGDVSGELLDREVWPYKQAEERAEPETFHLSVVAGGSTDERTRAVAAARLGVVSPTEEAESLESLVQEIHGKYERHDMADGSVIVFGLSGYRTSSAPDPV